jgi:hypothetical protein
VKTNLYSHFEEAIMENDLLHDLLYDEASKYLVNLENQTSKQEALIELTWAHRAMNAMELTQELGGESDER